MKRRYVLDAGVLALYFAGREDAREYIEAAYSGGAKVYMCEINVAEFLYNYARVFGWDAALARHALVRSSPITVVEVDERLTVEAAKLKHRHLGALSLADCYLVATAKLLKATVVTTYENVKDLGEVHTVLLKV